MLKKETVATAATIAIGFGISFLIVGTSETFQSCVGENYHHEASETLEKGLTELLGMSKVVSGCFGEFVHKNAESIIALFTVILGIATWLLWKATQKLVVGADLNAERQLRAYISFTPQSLSNAFPNFLPEASFIITNTGQTPAYNIRYSAILEVLPYPLARDQGDLVAVHSEHPTAGRPIHSKDDLFGGTKSLKKMTSDEYQKMIGSDHRLYLAGIVWYEDIFKKETRKTKFCVCVGGDDYGVFATQAFAQRKPIIIPMADWAFSHVHNDAT
jgi:hypothetical protein